MSVGEAFNFHNEANLVHRRRSTVHRC